MAPAMTERPHPPALPAFTPVPRAKDRSNGWKPEVQRAFIEALADTGSVEAAARRVGRSSVGAYQLRRHPQGHSFAEAWKAALDKGIQRIEDVAMDRALNGVEVPVYSYGKLVGTRRIYNDRLLMFMLRNRAPERFAADGARGLNALDKTRLEKMKKQWRKEWEAEKSGRSEVDVLNEINARIDRIRLSEERALSEETKRLRDAFEAAREKDLARRGLPSCQPDPAPEYDPPRPDPEKHPWLFRTREEPDDGWEIIDPEGED